jgi:DnaJ-class molecular chaperone
VTSLNPSRLNHVCDASCAHTIDVGPVKVQCPTCLGTKVESVYVGAYGGSITCRTCDGTGWVDAN